MIFELTQDIHEAVAVIPADHPKRPALEILANALGLSTHAVSEDSLQLASQLAGRVAKCGVADIEEILAAAERGAIRPWLQPVTASLLSSEEGLSRSCIGHLGKVRSVAIAPDGRLAVSGSDDQTARIWDAENGRQLLILVGHTKWVSAVAVTPDGRQVITGSADATIRLWDIKSGHEMAVLRGHQGRVWALAVGPDGRHAVSTDDRRTLWLWDLHERTGRLLGSSPHSVVGCAFTHDGSKVIGACAKGELLMWALSTGETVQLPSEFVQFMTSMAYLGEKTEALLGSSTGEVFLAAPESGSRKRFYQQGYDHAITAVVALPDGKGFLSGGRDGRIRQWDLSRDEPRREFPAHGGSVESLAVSGDGRRAVSGSQDGTVRLWRLAAGATAPRKGSQPDCGLIATGISSNGQHVVTVSDAGQVEQWATHTGTRLKSAGGPYGGCGSSLSVLPNSGRVLFFSPACGANLWDLTSETGRQIPNTQNGGKAELATTRDEHWAVCARENGLFELLDLDRLAVVNQGLGRIDRNILCLSENRQILVTGGSEGMVHLWRLPGFEPWLGVKTHSRITALAINNRHDVVLIGDANGVVQVWDIALGQLSGRFTGHTGWITALGFIPNCPLAISAAMDGRLHVWDPATMARVSTLQVDAGIGHVSVATESSRIVAADQLGHLHFLEFRGFSGLVASRHSSPGFGVDLHAGGDAPETQGLIQPTLRFQDGVTVSSISTRLRPGFGPLRCVAQFVDECKKYSGRILMSHEDTPEDDVEASSILGLLCLAAPTGTRLRITVQGTDLAAEQMTLRLLSALAGNDSLNLDFQKFVPAQIAAHIVPAT